MIQKSKVSWWRNEDDLFQDGKYSRKHLWSFDGGTEITASASPQIVPLPLSVEDAVDPEEAFVASLASCHMLFFLSVASSKAFTVDRYVDNAEGVLERNKDGMMITSVTLRPEVDFSGNKIPDKTQIEEIHRLAHEKCFLARSVRSHIFILPQ